MKARLPVTDWVLEASIQEGQPVWAGGLERKDHLNFLPEGDGGEECV